MMEKRLNQERNKVTRMWVEQRSFDQGRRKNDAFILSTSFDTRDLIECLIGSTPQDLILKRNIQDPVLSLKIFLRSSERVLKIYKKTLNKMQKNIHETCQERHHNTFWKIILLRYDFSIAL